jgi:RND family efflux transporter MFP subunit
MIRVYGVFVTVFCGFRKALLLLEGNLMKTFVLLSMLLSLTAALFFWQNQSSADDAAKPANPTTLAVATKPEKITAEGRITTYPDAEITVSADFSGLLQNLSVKEGDSVTQGQVIARIHAPDLQAALAEAKTKAMENRADIKLAETEFIRFKNLLARGSCSRQEFDKTERNLNAIKAHYATDLAEIQRLQAQLSKAQVTAPISGVVIERHIDAGEAVTPATPIVTIADLSQRRVEAEVDEFDVGKVTLNTPVQIYAEGFNGSWTGKVEEIPALVTVRKIKPQDPARPVDTRVLMVKISLDDKKIPLKLGQRVNVSIGL